MFYFNTWRINLHNLKFKAQKIKRPCKAIISIITIGAFLLNGVFIDLTWADKYGFVSTGADTMHHNSPGQLRPLAFAEKTQHVGSSQNAGEIIIRGDITHEGEADSRPEITALIRLLAVVLRNNGYGEQVQTAIEYFIVEMCSNALRARTLLILSGQLGIPKRFKSIDEFLLSPDVADDEKWEVISAAVTQGTQETEVKIQWDITPEYLQIKVSNNTIPNDYLMERINRSFNEFDITAALLEEKPTPANRRLAGLADRITGTGRGIGITKARIERLGGRTSYGISNGWTSFEMTLRQSETGIEAPVLRSGSGSAIPESGTLRKEEQEALQSSILRPRAMEERAESLVLTMHHNSPGQLRPVAVGERRSGTPLEGLIFRNGCLMRFFNLLESLHKKNFLGEGDILIYGGAVREEILNKGKYTSDFDLMIRPILSDEERQRPPRIRRKILLSRAKEIREVLAAALGVTPEKLSAPTYGGKFEGMPVGVSCYLDEDEVPIRFVDKEPAFFIDLSISHAYISVAHKRIYDFRGGQSLADIRSRTARLVGFNDPSQITLPAILRAIRFIHQYNLNFPSEGEDRTERIIRDYFKRPVDEISLGRFDDFSLEKQRAVIYRLFSRILDRAANPQLALRFLQEIDVNGILVQLCPQIGKKISRFEEVQRYAKPVLDGTRRDRNRERDI